MKNKNAVIAVRTTRVAVFAAAAFLMSFFNVFGPIDKLSEDVLYHHPSGASEIIKIIKIDDKTLNSIGDYESWERDIYADLVNTVCTDNSRPAVIGFDILFGSERDPEADKQFADACARYGSAVCAFSYVFEKELVSDGSGKLAVTNLSVSDTVLPYSDLYAVTRHGFANALIDNKDGLIRSSFLYFDGENGQREYSFNAEVYMTYCEAMGITPKFPGDMKDQVFSFRYSGKPGDYEAVSLCDVLDGTVPPEAFDGCIVLVGSYSAGMMDSYYIPVDRGQQMFGVEIHANAIQALLDERYLIVMPLWLSALISAVCAAILVLVCRKLSINGTVICCGIFIAGKLLAGYLLFSVGQYGISGNILSFPITAVAFAGYNTIVHYYKASHDKRRIEKAFKKYVAPQVVSKIAKSGTYELILGGENRNVAVLFVDIRGFTPLSESLEPEQVVEILNSYLKLTTTCILEHEGMLDKFVGDATMAVFNAPFDTEDYIYKAVLTAWDIIRGGERIDRECFERFGKHVGFGVGVNCGPAVVGNIGCDFRMDYTAIGDTVNTAARIEANAPKGKAYISKAVYEQIKDRITAEELGEIPLKGKSKGVFVYSVTGVEADKQINDTTEKSGQYEEIPYNTR